MIVTVVNMRMKVLPMTQVSGLVTPPPPTHTFCVLPIPLQSKKARIGKCPKVTGRFE